ncbi:hypothetical protein BGW42_006635 [Actinomortierella wolfii]|nr:hypothetical protein BGW42_006635 [Actinomortierella wolfii]
MPTAEWTDEDMDLLRQQEWRLLFASKQQAASNTPSSLSDATFLIKGYFAPAQHLYLIMITDLRQCWVEKMEREDIRERSMSIKTFDYEDDSQLEELLKTLESIFAKEHTPAATRRLEVDEKNMLTLRDEFKYGLAKAEWHFNLSPTIDYHNTSASGGSRPTTSSTTTKLWDQNVFDVRYPSFLNRNQQQQQRTTDFDLQENEQHDSIVSGPLLMYEHLSLPLVAILNAYRKQVRNLESVIKSKELEVRELLDLLEVNGIANQHRHRATEPYRSKDTESPVVANIKSVRHYGQYKFRGSSDVKATGSSRTMGFILRSSNSVVLQYSLQECSRQM